MIPVGPEPKLFNITQEHYITYLSAVRAPLAIGSQLATSGRN